MTELMLWRHAEAEDFSATGKDTDRALTRRGHKDAASMAKWLARYLPADTLVLCSPAMRCQETAAALSEVHQIEVKTESRLSVEASLEQMSQILLDYADAKALLLVGHQPNLGMLIAKLSGMQQSTGVVKKGSVWWLRQRVIDNAVEYYTYAVQQPNH